MWFLAILVILNAFANNSDFVNNYRLNIGGMPANVFDGLIVLGTIIALLRPRTSANFVQTDRMHPMMTGTLILFGLGLFGGMIGGSGNGASTRQIITCLRNFAAAPACLYLAYFLTANVKSSRWYLYICIAAGLMVSFMILVFFREKTTGLSVGSNASLNEMRAVDYISTYAGLAMALIFYSIASGLKLLPLPLAICVMGACLVGQFTTLSRSDWLSAAAALGVAFILLPKQQRIKSALRALLALPFLLGSMWLGLHAASQLTGKDFFGRMEERLHSMLPGSGSTKMKKAWATRLPGTFQELRKWSESPIIGKGFGIADTPQMESGTYVGIRHNTWSATLSETGLLGFGAFFTMVAGSFVLGWKMVRARTDQTTMLIGAFGVMTATFFWFHGLATMSFNQFRWGLPFFITTGVLLRTRAMQLAMIRQAEAEHAIIEQHVDPYGYPTDPNELDAAGQPVYGRTWYQTN